MFEVISLAGLIALGLTYLLHSTVWIVLVDMLSRLQVLNAPHLKNNLWKATIIGSLFTSFIAFGNADFPLTISSSENKPIISTPLPESVVAETNNLEATSPDKDEDLALLSQRPTNQREKAKFSMPVIFFLMRSLLLFWLAGVLFLSIKNGYQHRRFFKEIGHRQFINHPTILNILETIQSKAQLDFSIRLTSAPFLDSPIVIRNREICLPEKALESMDEEKLAAMMAHEMAHLIRRDYYWTFLLLILEILFFFQPLHRIVRKGIHTSNELLCDAWAAKATGNAVALAQCLVEVATWMNHRRKHYSLVTGMALKPTELSNRIFQLLNLPDMTLQRFKFFKIGLPALGILALALFVLPGFSFVLTKAETPPNSTVSEVSMSYNCQDLLLAVKANDLDKVKEIIKTVEPNCSFYNDGEPRSSLVAAARNGNVEIGKVLLAAKAEVEYHAEGDESPLIAAANYGHLDFARMLIDQGAKVNRKVRGDGTALIGAARGGHYKVAKLLLENGADPYLSVSGDEYPMYHAREAGNKPLIKLLASYEK